MANFKHSRITSEFSFEAKRKAQFAIFLVSFLAPLMIFYSINNFLDGALILSVINGIMSISLVLSLILSRTFLLHRRQQIYTIQIAFTFIYMMYLIVDNRGDSSRAFWMFVYPIAALYLLGRRRSMPWLICFVTILSLYLFGRFPLIKPYPLATPGKIRFFGSLLIVSGVAYTFVWIRDRFSQELETQNLTLHREKEKLIQAMNLAEVANDTKSKFLANMSHELRTPLNHIIGFTELIWDEKMGKLNQTQKEYLDDVLQSSNHLLSLINDILDLSKVEAGKMVFVPERVNVEAIISEGISMLAVLARQNEITISSNNEDAPEYITADERKLKQILFNLISNAVKFSHPGGKVLIRYGQAATFFISVQDTGIGIAKPDMLSIFKPFSQVDSSPDRIYQGTGLGLALTRQLVELHGGTISVYSDGPGKGSTFTVSLPRTL